MEVNLHDFKNILYERDPDVNDFKWMYRKCNSRKAWQPRTKWDPQIHSKHILFNHRLYDRIVELKKRANIPEKLVFDKINDILNEVAYKKDIRVIRILGIILYQFSRKLLGGIYIHRSSFSEVNSLMGRVPIIFVPTHRSYADFILMSIVCFNEDIEIPAIAAGMDFYKMRILGETLRRTGAFFMRRSYNDDMVYWSVFKQYVEDLVTTGCLPLEFFVEGTRSRTCKTLPPKYGLLLMILRSLFMGQVPDIIFVPISISYERVLEEKLFAYELLGMPKPPESTKGLFKSLAILRERFGNVFLRCGQPISAKECFALDGSSRHLSRHHKVPLHQYELSTIEKQLVPNLAYRILAQQQYNSVLSTFNIVALIINWELYKGRMEFNITEMKSQVYSIRNVLKAFGPTVHYRNIIESLNIHQNFIAIDIPTNSFKLIKYEPPQTNVRTGRDWRGHSFNQVTLSTAIPYFLLQMYLNPLLFCLIDATVIIHILKCRGRHIKDQLAHDFKFLRSLLSYEFIKTDHNENMTEVFNRTLNKLSQLHMVTVCDDQIELNTSEFFTGLLSRLLDVFLLTYFTTCKIVSQVRQNSTIEQEIIVNTQQNLEQTMDQKSRDFVHPYCLCIESIKNCLLYLYEQKIVGKKYENGGNMYYVTNINELLLIMNNLRATIDLSDLHHLFTNNNLKSKL